MIENAPRNALRVSDPFAAASLDSQNLMKAIDICTDINGYLKAFPNISGVNADHASLLFTECAARLIPALIAGSDSKVGNINALLFGAESNKGSNLAANNYLTDPLECLRNVVAYACCGDTETALNVFKRTAELLRPIK